MEEQNKNDEFTYGSEELSKELEYEETNYVKFELGKPMNIVVLDSLIKKEIKEFEPGNPVVRFNISIKINDEEKTWSVSRRVLNIINEYIKETNRFKVVRREMAYDVIPLGLK